MVLVAFCFEMPVVGVIVFSPELVLADPMMTMMGACLLSALPPTMHRSQEVSRVFTYARFLGLDTVSTWVHSTSAYCSTRQIDSPLCCAACAVLPRVECRFQSSAKVIQLTYLVQVRCPPFPSSSSATSIIVAMDAWAPVVFKFQFSIFFSLSYFALEKERYGQTRPHHYGLSARRCTNRD